MIIMDEAVQAISQQTEVPIPKFPRRSKKFSALIISLFVLIVIASFFGGMYYQGMSQRKITMNTRLAPIANDPAPTKDPTMNWKTYVSDRYQFSFKYPANAEIAETTAKGQTNQDDTVITVSLGGGKLVITPNRFGMGLDPLKVESATIGGVLTTKYYTAKDRGTYSEIASPIGEYKLGFDFTLPEDTTSEAIDMTFDQILKTFKFTGEKITDASNWKTYSNSENGYSIKYPTDILVRLNCPGEELVLEKKTLANASQESVPLETCARDARFLMEFRTFNDQDAFLPDKEHYEVTSENAYFNNYPGTKYTYKQIKPFSGAEGPSWYQLVVFARAVGGNEMYLGNEEYATIRDQILSTLSYEK